MILLRKSETTSTSWTCVMDLRVMDHQLPTHIIQPLPLLIMAQPTVLRLLKSFICLLLRYCRNAVPMMIWPQLPLCMRNLQFMTLVVWTMAHLFHSGITLALPAAETLFSKILTWRVPVWQVRYIAVGTPVRTCNLFRRICSILLNSCFCSW